MITKGKLKELTAYRLQKRCDEQAVFIAEGPKLAAEALASRFPIRTICATAPWIEAHADAIQSIETYEVDADTLPRLSLQQTPNQVWMLIGRPTAATAYPSPSTPCILALDRLQDPGNLGTIMRTADWYGIRRIICSRDSAGCFNPKVVQASMGAIFRTSVEYTDLPQWLSTCGMPIYGATLHGLPLAATPHPTTTSVLLIGNESRGISPEALKEVNHPVLIPNRGGTAESLNASVAAAILINQLWNN
ncbi:MAG: RNA methyltransferase [Bacteroidales bacterium]|nr:RNA methyltransferase [Bacteroidales bacterium]